MKKGKISITLAGLCFLSFTGCGKSEWVTFSDTKKDQITSIVESGTSIWYGTRTGLVQFDKATEKRKVYTVNNGLPDNDIKYVTRDAKGKIWIGTNLGLSSFDGQNWDVYSTAESKLPGDLINGIAFENTTVWAATGGGLGRFDGTEWTPYTHTNSGLLDDVAQCVVVDPAGNKWIGTQDGGVFKFKDTTWVGYDTTSYSPIKMPVVNIKSIAIEKSGILWLGTARGLMRFDGKKIELYNTKNSGIPDNLIRGLAIDGAGNKWIATTKGLVKFDGTKWTTYTIANSKLPADRVTAVFVGDKDHIWVGCEGWGLTVFRETGVTLTEE